MMSDKICCHFNCFPMGPLDSSNDHWCPDCKILIDEKEMIRVNNLIDRKNKFNKVLNKIENGSK